jgi:hypothetical protein
MENADVAKDKCHIAGHTKRSTAIPVGHGGGPTTLHPGRHSHFCMQMNMDTQVRRTRVKAHKVVHLVVYAATQPFCNKQIVSWSGPLQQLGFNALPLKCMQARAAGRGATACEREAVKGEANATGRERKNGARAASRGSRHCAS